MIFRSLAEHARSATTRALASAAILLLASAAAHAQSSAPVVLTFLTVGDSRQDPITFDKPSVGSTLTGQDGIGLQNTKAFARILRTIQAQKASMLFFNGDLIHGYGWADIGYMTLPRVHVHQKVGNVLMKEERDEQEGVGSEPAIHGRVQG